MNDVLDQVWADLPAWKHVCGRSRVDRIVGRVVKRWPVGEMLDGTHDEQFAAVSQLASGVEAEERQEYRMGVILSILLSALISEIVKAIWRWWSQSASSRVELLRWRSDL
jgi:hypothetical protein